MKWPESFNKAPFKNCFFGIKYPLLRAGLRIRVPYAEKAVLKGGLRMTRAIDLDEVKYSNLVDPFSIFLRVLNSFEAMT